MDTITNDLIVKGQIVTGQGRGFAMPIATCPRVWADAQEISVRTTADAGHVRGGVVLGSVGTDAPTFDAHLGLPTWGPPV